MVTAMMSQQSLVRRIPSLPGSYIYKWMDMMRVIYTATLVLLDRGLLHTLLSLKAVVIAIGE